ncbi:hypothetical protein SAMN05444266_106261 [Chitinophaga jiangningensis]|uniref:Uncharacterized protein n=1 Tax=Chitinophaga jiangningensis TaxID=1419482 RepID=A0A1M7FTU0_9BACT|nr:hypothetical protein [Chitinophaga jiangningensis]SHM07069.1 hypothetical protein SAMN05444266_106261 [Chitinophaga jiangningensis]
MNYKKFIAFSISFLAVFFGNIIYILSCGGGEIDPYDYYISYFNAYTKGQGYEPFYFTSLSNYYDNATPDEATVNVQDWRNYADDKSVSIDDIYRYIYQYDREQMAQIADCSAKGQTCAFADSVRSNSFAMYLANPKHTDAARYLLFAKDCEKVVYNPDPWSDRGNLTPEMTALYDQGKGLLAGVKDKDIAQRYKFQLLRLTHYRKLYKETVEAFDKDFGKAGSNNLIYNKALALKAGALYHLDDSVNAAYLFSKVFAAEPGLREMAFLNVRWTNTAATDIFALCRNNKEKANAVALYSFQSPFVDLTPLRMAYQLDPAAPALSPMLTREINKLESEFFTPRVAKAADSIGLDLGYYSYMDYYDETKGINYRDSALALQRFADEAVQKGKVQDLDFWKVSAAYIAFIRKDLSGAKSRLEKYPVQDPAIKDQWELVNLLVTLNEQKQLDQAYEAKLLGSLKWMETKLGKLNQDEYWYNSDKKLFFNKAMRNILATIIAPAYHKQGDYTKEALVRGRCDSLRLGTSPYGAEDMVENQMSAEQLIALHTFLKSENKTAYEKYLVSHFPKDLNMELAIGIAYMRVSNFTAALPWLKKVPTAAQPASYQIWVDQLQDFGEDTATAKHRTLITASQFCEEMVRLLGLTKKKPVSAAVYHKIATGLFNISYYGKTWFMLKEFRPSTLWYTAKCEKDPFERQYFGVYDAEIFYTKAAQASTDKEFKARCLFLAARCAQKHVPDNEDDKLYYLSLVRNRYFPVLASNYNQTALYRKVYDQCSYLQDYVIESRKKK